MFIFSSLWPSLLPREWSDPRGWVHPAIWCYPPLSPKPPEILHFEKIYYFLSRPVSQKSTREAFFRKNVENAELNSLTKSY